jgi:hypothetical protein
VPGRGEASLPPSGQAGELLSPGDGFGPWIGELVVRRPRPPASRSFISFNKMDWRRSSFQFVPRQSHLFVICYRQERRPGTVRWQFVPESVPRDLLCFL